MVEPSIKEGYLTENSKFELQKYLLRTRKRQDDSISAISGHCFIYLYFGSMIRSHKYIDWETYYIGTLRL